jgi:hypothetical protein
MVISCYRLGEHLESYTNYYNERKEFRESLLVLNESIRSRIPTEDNFNFDSPITKVVKLIRNIQLNEGYKIKNDTLDTLDYIVRLLKSPHLFEPELKNTNMESEVKQWLHEITNVEERDGKSIFSRASSSIVVKEGHIAAHKYSYLT